MPRPTCTDEQFVSAWKRLGGAEAVAKFLGLKVRGVHARRRNIEKKLGVRLIAGGIDERVPARYRMDIDDGAIIVFSDAHWWDSDNTVAECALLELCRRLNPVAIVANGDIFDGAAISRHPPNRWEDKPTVAEEIFAVRSHLAAIEKAAPNAVYRWTWGNHDSRFDTYLATNAPGLEGVHGSTLMDHIHWPVSMSIFVNDEIVIKHRFKGGIHATHNNALWSGRTIVTGHLHSLKITPFSDYNGTRYGIDTGTLADPIGPQFTYGEDDPKNMRSGFAVLTIKDGKLLRPEVCEVIDDRACFRGEWVC